MGGASSKQTFTELVHVLLEKDIDNNDHEFWDEMWKTVLTIEEIFEVISADNVRRLVAEHPENIRTIFTQAVAQLYQVIQTPYPIYFQQALNCTRVLCRILPFLLENGQSKFVQELLWSRRVVKSVTVNANGEPVSTSEGNTAATSQDGTTAGGKENSKSEDDSQTVTESVSGSETAPNGGGDDNEEFQESEPLAVILVNTIYHLLFLPDFTIEDPNVDFSESDVDTPAFKSALMWAPGVGSVEKTVVTSTQFDTNRAEILRMLIAAFSDSLFQNPDSYDSCASLWLEVATSVDAPYAEIVFNSLMNAVLGKMQYMHLYVSIISSITYSFDLFYLLIQVMIQLAGVYHMVI